MKPNLLVFEKENTQNSYINFAMKMKPSLNFSELSQEEKEGLLRRRDEMLQKIEKEIYDHYLDETNEDSWISDDEDDFPCRAEMTGNYYVGRESYSVCYLGEEGQHYRIKNGQYKYSHGDIFLPLDSPEITRAYQMIYSIRMTYHAPDGKERDYISFDFVAELRSLDDEILVEELGMDAITGADIGFD